MANLILTYLAIKIAFRKLRVVHASLVLNNKSYTIPNFQLVCRGSSFVCACVSNVYKKNQRPIHSLHARDTGQGHWMLKDIIATMVISVETSLVTVVRVENLD